MCMQPLRNGFRVSEHVWAPWTLTESPSRQRNLPIVGWERQSALWAPPSLLHQLLRCLLMSHMDMVAEWGGSP